MDKTLYMEIYGDISRDILSGRLLPHSRLPSKRQMCALKGVSQSTVETAYGILLSEGYIYSLPKKGYFVSRLESLENVAEPPKEKETASAPAEENKVFCSLSTNGADTSVFPYSVWARLTKEVVYGSPQLLQRGMPQGDIELRQALCDFLHSYREVNCTPGQIVVGAGMDYLLDIVLRLLPRDTVFALEDPGYNATYGVIEATGRAVCPIPVDENGMNVDSLYKSGASVAYVTPSHQFPLGITMPVSRRTQLLKWASEKPGRYIIEDDYDSEFRYAYRPVRSIQGMDKSGKVIYIGTLSRSLAPSVRIAYMVIPPSLLERYKEVSGYMSSTVSRFEQHTICRFINGGHYARHLRRAGNLYKQKQTLMRQLLSEISEVTVRGEEAGLHFLVSHQSLSETQLVERAKNEGIIVRGVSGCYKKAVPNGEGTVMIGFASPSIQALHAAARRLKKAWSE